MKKFYFLLLLLVIFTVCNIFYVWHWKNRDITANSSPAFSPSDVTKKKSDEEAVDGTNPSNWQHGLTPQEIMGRINEEVEQQGGALKIWKRKLVAANEEALKIRNVKMTEEMKAFLTKVGNNLHGGAYLINSNGAEIGDYQEAKRAFVVFSQQYNFSIPAKSAIYNQVVYFIPQPIGKTLDGKAIKVASDFSHGWAIKLIEKNVIKIYQWDFNEIPPADGVIRIEAEFE